MFAGEGDPFRTNRRFKLLSAGRRGHPALDRVRLRHALRPRPRPAPRHLRQGRHLRRLGRHARRHEGALRRLRPGLARRPSVSMTINGPAPTVLAFFLNTVIDQQVDAFRAEHGREPDRGRARRARGVRPGQRARHRAGRHPQGGPGPEHLPVLHRVLAADDGRHPGVVHRAAGAQLLLGVDLRLPHRRGRGEPHQPARVHPRQRVHLRRGLPRPRHGHRRLRAQPVVLLLQRHGPRVLRARPRRPPDLGGRDAREVRRQRALAEAEVPRADLRPVAARAGDGLQRHPHHAAGADRDLRQRQQPAHQRLRRGRHHARPRSPCAARSRSS